MSKPILILNGPNLNLLGTREPHIYGSTTLKQVEEMCKARADKRGLTISFHQSNSEAQIIDWIQGGINGADGIIINPAAFTHTSVAILDALNMIKAPIIELHISNPHKREPFRHHSYVTFAATALICGLGVNGYPLAVDAMADLLEAKKAQIMSAFDHIAGRARTRAILWITIDRPQALNALNPQAHRELSAALDRTPPIPPLRVAVITGAGERAFCVGSDLKARAVGNADDHPPTGFGGISHRFDLAKPVIAAVNGLALGGGVEIVAACDLAIAADHAEFALPEPRVGLAALGGGGLQRLARNLPLKYAMELVLTGRRFGAEEAKRIGLINDVVPRAELKARVRQMADAIIAGAPLAVEASKQVMLQSLALPDLATALRATYPAAERMLASEDAREGQRAFVEKRKPRWQGK